MLELLEAIFDEVKPMLGEGKVADLSLIHI